MDEEILSLKWNNHNSTFIHTLSSLHKLETYSDVTLACDGKYFPVHKLVLSVCSEYFEEILSQTKCQHPVVVLKDIKHNDLEVLLNYMYAGEANVVQSELASLIKAAECLRIKGLAVPDETPPVRDKRHSELFETSHHHKKRRSDEGSCLSNNGEVGRELDKSEDNQVENLNRERGQEEELPVESHSKEPSNPPPAIDADREGRKVIPEIVLEGEPIEVKQEVAEPKIEEHDESQQTLESKLDITYSMNLGEDDILENERQATDSQTSHILQDLMSQSLPGTSGVQGPDGLSMWESNTASLPSYSVESYSSDDSRNHQMGDASSASFLRGSGAGGAPAGRGGAIRQEYLASDLLLSRRGAVGAPQSTTASGLSPMPTQHQCHCCPKRFLTRQDLRRHLRTHTGERPFKCMYCSYRAALKGNVKKHVLTVHKTLTIDEKAPQPHPSQVLQEFMNTPDDAWQK